MWQTPRLSQFEIQRILNKVHEVLRVKHYSTRTEESYIHWIQYYLRFRQNQDPLRMGKSEAIKFLTPGCQNMEEQEWR